MRYSSGSGSCNVGSMFCRKFPVLNVGVFVSIECIFFALSPVPLCVVCAFVSSSYERNTVSHLYVSKFRNIEFRKLVEGFMLHDFAIQIIYC